MADYTQEIQDAIDIIAEFGGSFTFQNHAPTIADVNKPWRTAAAAPTEFTATAVMVDFKVSQQSAGFTAGSEDTQGVLPGDMMIYLAAGDPAVTFRPSPRDTVVTPNSLGQYNVIDNKILAPDGTPILYKLWVRK